MKSLNTRVLERIAAIMALAILIGPLAAAAIGARAAGTADTRSLDQR